MLKAYGRLVYRYRIYFLAFGLFCMAVSLFYAKGIFSSLSQSGYSVPNSQSKEVDNIVKNDFGGNRSSLILLFSSTRLRYTQSSYKQAVDTIMGNIQNLPVVSSTSSFYSTGDQQFISQDPHLTYALVGLKGNDNTQANEVSQIYPWIKSNVLKVKLGGSAAANSELSGYVQRDLKTAELFSFPLATILLLIIFGSIAAASLPLALGVYGIIGALVITRLVTIAMPISVYVLDIVSLLGLGLGIDYSLFIVSRFREELAKRSNDVEEALSKTVATAGKTVIFSGLTVMAAIAVLVIFPIDYIRSMGVGGAAAVLIAVIGSLLFLPSLLAVMGTKVNSLKISNVIPAGVKRRLRGTNYWTKITTAVIRYPVITIVFTLAILLLAGTPFLNVHFTSGGYDVLPQGSSARQVSEILSRKFKYGNQSPIYVIVPTVDIKSNSSVEKYQAKLKSYADVSAINTSIANNNYLYFSVLPKSKDMSKASENLVKQIRSTNVDGIQGMVGGDTASLLDFIELIAHYGIYAAIIIMVAMLILFYLLLGSILIPLKTIILTTMSLSASFGFLVWVFQEGHLNNLIGITKLSGIDASQLVIIFALAFGLSMDYAAFLFSRVKENFWEHTDMSRAIVWGVQRTGSIITSAAILLLAVIGSFAVGQVVSMKEVAIGLIVAVVVDVFVVRLLLVPASMKLLGKYNWWLPRPLQYIYDRFGLKEE